MALWREEGGVVHLGATCWFVLNLDADAHKWSGTMSG